MIELKGSAWLDAEGGRMGRWEFDPSSLEAWSFGELFRKLRELTGRSGKLLADYVGVHRAQITRWEQGKSLPRPEHLEAITEFLREHRPARISGELWEEALEQLRRKAGFAQDPLLVEISRCLARWEDPRTAQASREVLRTVRDLFLTLQAADEFVRQRQWEQAMWSLQEAEIRLPSGFSNRMQLEICRRKSFVSYRLLRYDQAMTEAEHTLQLAEKVGDWVSRGDILVFRGDLYRRIGQFERARKDFEEALICYERARLPEGERARARARCYRKRAVTYLFQGWPMRASRELQQAQLALEQARETDGRAIEEEQDKILQVRGWMLLQIGRVDEAISIHVEVVSRLKRHYLQNPGLDPWGMAKALRYLGDAYWAARSYEKAQRSYMEAHEICMQIHRDGRDTRLLEALIELGLGRIAMNQGQPTEARDHLVRAARFIRGLRIDSRFPEVLMELANLAWQMKSPQVPGMEMSVQDAIDMARARFREFKNWSYYAQSLILSTEWFLDDIEDDAKPEDWNIVMDLLDELKGLVFDQDRVREMVPEALPGARLVDEIPLLFYHLAIANLLRARLGLRLGWINEAITAFHEAVRAVCPLGDAFLSEIIARIHRLAEHVAPEVRAEIMKNLELWMRTREEWCSQGVFPQGISD
jgi:tetratricopeptide (TPR) repeat protein